MRKCELTAFDVVCIGFLVSREVAEQFLVGERRYDLFLLISFVGPGK